VPLLHHKDDVNDDTREGLLLQ